MRSWMKKQRRKEEMNKISFTFYCNRHKNILAVVACDDAAIPPMSYMQHKGSLVQ
jgi:hypothetical protein